MLWSILQILEAVVEDDRELHGASEGKRQGSFDVEDRCEIDQVYIISPNPNISYPT